jgi:hypothetical protein
MFSVVLVDNQTEFERQSKGSSPPAMSSLPHLTRRYHLIYPLIAFGAGRRKARWSRAACRGKRQMAALSCH